MRNICLVLIALPLMCVTPAVAQDVQSNTNKGKVSLEPEINQLTSTSAPAFSILDLSPASISAPISPRDFSTTILTSLAQSSSNLPDNLAVEIAPYWWKSRPDLSFNEYVNPDSIVDVVIRSMSFSLASRSVSENDVESTDIGVGVRFSLVPGKPGSKLKNSVLALQEAQLAYLDATDNDVCEAQEEKALAEAKAAGRTTADFEYTGECKVAIDRVKNSLVKDVTTGLKNRVGFQADFALANAYRIPDSSTGQRKRTKSSAWLTLSYTPTRDSKGGVQYLGILRYIDSFDSTSNEFVDAFDIGARLLWEHDSIPLLGSVEYINRTKNDAEDSERYGFTLEYLYNPTLSFVVSYGKNFTPFETERDLLVLGGIRLNLGTGPSVPADLAGGS